MKVVFCDNGLEPFLNFRGYIACHFHKLGYDCSLIVPEYTCSNRFLDKKPRWLTLFPVEMNRDSSNPIKDIQYYRQVLSVLKSNRPNILFTYTIKPNIYATMAAKKLGIPVVSMVAGLGYAFSGNSIIHRLGRMLYRFGLSKADKVIVLNKSNYQTLLEKKFAKKENIIIFEGGEGVDLTQFYFHEDPYENVRFLMVARVLYDKGYSEFVEAARIVKEKYPEIKIELLGPLAESSPMGVPEAVVRADHQSGVISYLGETDNVPEAVGLNGVVVVVVSYHEGFNRSLMEACAMGRICITSDIPGCKEIVRNDYNGYLVKPKDPIMLAEAMIKVINATTEQRVKMAGNSYTLAKNVFDIKHVYKKYDNIILEVLNK